ncbi:F-box protein [Senna tora]|uniref:F-box protein n=1 Tax=Senna tora TaxID=362788 RepID=A0A834WL37_9FABA|nr:F-box protein [Senna tora]
MELPDHLISDIFSWLPAKSLCKFKCCSKSISRLTRDKYFAIKHSQNSSLKDDSSFLIQSHVFEDGRTEIHGLPSSSSSSSYDEGKESPPSNFGFRIYDSEKGVWEIRENHLVVPGKAIEGLDFRFPVFHKGAIHFLSCDPHGPYILAYNVESGISTTLNLPQECRETEFKARIFKWGKAGRSNYDDDDDESICLVRFDGEKKSFGIWVLMDYETSFWSKLLEISFEEMELGSDDFSVSGYSVMNGNSLVFVHFARAVLVRHKFTLLRE